MNLDPTDPPKPPSRLIVPGEEPTPREDAPRRIILPPGAQVETTEDLPEYPRLRPLILMPFNDGKRDLLLVSDPLGVLPNQAVLSAESLPLLQLLDGSASITDITAAVMRESKDLRLGNVIKDFVAQLDRLLLLDSPRFDAAFKSLREEYHRLEIRQAALEGRSYPAEREAAAAFVDAHYAEAEEWRVAAAAPIAAPGVRPRALATPHLDPKRAGAAIARGFLEVGTPLPGPVRFVVFGTGHSLFGDTFALTRKHFETPFGKVTSDFAFIDAVADRLGEAAYHGELAHREEHSIEFQALYLKRRFGDQPFTLVPILCGGFHGLLEDGRTPREEPAFEAMLQAVREAERASSVPTVYVAGIDLSHVGTRFGDPAVDERMEKEIEAFDRGALGTALRGDADGWFQLIADKDDATRVCGWAPMYATLRCAEPAPGRLLRYEQSLEADGSMVTIGTLVWG